MAKKPKIPTPDGGKAWDGKRTRNNRKRTPGRHKAYINLYKKDELCKKEILSTYTIEEKEVKKFIKGGKGKFEMITRPVKTVEIYRTQRVEPDVIVEELNSNERLSIMGIIRTALRSRAPLRKLPAIKTMESSISLLKEKTKQKFIMQSRPLMTGAPLDMFNALRDSTLSYTDFVKEQMQKYASAGFNLHPAY